MWPAAGSNSSNNFSHPLPAAFSGVDLLQAGFLQPSNGQDRVPAGSLKRKATDSENTYSAERSHPWTMQPGENQPSPAKKATNIVSYDENVPPKSQTPPNFQNPVAHSTPLPNLQWQVAAMYGAAGMTAGHPSKLPPQLVAPSCPGAPTFEPQHRTSFPDENTDNSGDSGTSLSNDTNNSEEDSRDDFLPAAPNGDPGAVFAAVPGRLHLLANNKKLNVYVAEVRRRIGQPECLNQSILSAILRKAKNKDGGQQMADALKQHNISLVQGRRKCVPNSMFTALCEEEALAFGKDFHNVSMQSFPFKALAYEFIANMPVYHPFEIQAMKQRLVDTMAVLSSISALCGRDNSPLLSKAAPTQLGMHPDSQKDFTNFSLITHGFGILGHQASWSTTRDIVRVIYEALQNPVEFCMSQGKPLPMWTSMTQ